MASSNSLRKRTKKAPEGTSNAPERDTSHGARLKSRGLMELTITAVVGIAGEKVYLSTDETVDLFGLMDARALRKWHSQGCPFERAPDRSIRYPLPDVIVWHTNRQILIAQGEWQGKAHLDMNRACELEMIRQWKDRIAPAPCILVPLEHDHPMRARQLTLACTGLTPAVFDD